MEGGVKILLCFFSQNFFKFEMATKQTAFMGLKMQVMGEILWLCFLLEEINISSIN
jgi:hypothetical protein